MKLLTYATESHKGMLDDFFIPSVPDTYDLYVGTGGQHSKDGSYFSEGFQATTMDKMAFILDEMDNMAEGERVLYSDCDAIFLRPLNAYLEMYNDYDMTFQHGHPELNTGFIYMRNCIEVRRLISDVISGGALYRDDQRALNSITNYYAIKMGRFDDTISSIAFMKREIWRGGNVELPGTPLYFHACWCVGVSDKIKLLNIVREKYGKS